MKTPIETPRQNTGRATAATENTSEPRGPFRSLLHLGGQPGEAPTAEAVYAELWANDLLRSLEYGYITVTIDGHRAVLRGHVTAGHSRRWAEQIARQAPGVEAVENQLVDDDELVNLVCCALVGNPRTAHEFIPVLVAARHGVIVLSGSVSSAALRDAVEECAAGVSQVRAVSNYIEAPGVAVDPDAERVAQPRIGEEVIASDWPLGRVEAVIINVRNRRVASVVTSGQFPDLSTANPRPSWDHFDTPRLRRTVAIPVQAIAEATPCAVWLHVDSADAARYPDFDPTCFRRPETWWQPPYPYEAGDVWLDAHSRQQSQSEAAPTRTAPQP